MEKSRDLEKDFEDLMPDFKQEHEKKIANFNKSVTSLPNKS